MEYALLIPAFIAGLLTFLAPCTLPLVPGYLGFISGVSLGDLKNPVKSSGVRLKIFLNGLFFVLGFSAVFILMGTLVGFAGVSLLAPYRMWLSRIGGIFVIIFGLFMLHPVRNPLSRLGWYGGSRLERLISNGVNVFNLSFISRELKLSVSPIFERGKPVNSFILGSAFAFGWTPCVGPILGSILLLASTSTTVFQGALLLTIFSAGLALPFLLIAAGIGSASRYLEKFSGLLSAVLIMGGIFLIFLGTLLLTGNIVLLTSWGYYLFRFLEYDKLLDYL